MRQIKFKAWDFERKEMYIPSMLSNKEEDMYFTSQRYQGDSAGILMQFTGLTDKNGKEIYEGDIISDYTPTDEGIVKSHNPVFFDEKEGCWSVDLSYSKDRSTANSLVDELKHFDYEVSGNIYENPELLKQ